MQHFRKSKLLPKKNYDEQISKSSNKARIRSPDLSIRLGLQEGSQGILRVLCLTSLAQRRALELTQGHRPHQPGARQDQRLGSRAFVTNNSMSLTFSAVMEAGSELGTHPTLKGPPSLS